MTAEPEAPSLDELARRMRGSLASLRAAAEALERYPAMAPEQRARLHAVLADESQHLAWLVDQLERTEPDAPGSDRVRLQVPEFLQGVRGALARPGLHVELDDDVMEGHLAVDAESLHAALRALAAELRREFAVQRSTLRAEEVDAHLLLDWAWLPEPARVQAVQDWQGAALDGAGGEPSLRAAARTHGGEAWFDLDRDEEDGGRRAHVRVLLPLTEA